MDNGSIWKSLSGKPEKADPRPEMTPRLDSSVVLAKDLSEQPPSSHLLLVGAGRPNYYSIDAWQFGTEVATFYCEGMVVYACRLKEGAWAIVKRDCVQVVTERDLTKRQHADQKEAETFYNDLDPEAWKEAQEMAKHHHGGVDLSSLLGGQQQGHAPQKEDKRPMPGHYL